MLQLQLLGSNLNARSLAKHANTAESAETTTWQLQYDV
jgi:hypothetical protein